MAAARASGVDATARRFTPEPTSSVAQPKFSGRRCVGVALSVAGQDVDAFALGLRLLRALRAQPGFAWPLGGRQFDTLVGTGRVRRELDRGASVADILRFERAGVRAWLRVRAPALLYED